MAAQDSGPPKFNPKHRIIGAIILVALAVIFIPMLLDETQPPPDLKGAPEIPERPATPETKVVVRPVTSPDAKDKEKPGAEPAKEPAKEPRADSGGEAFKPVAPAADKAETKAATAQPSKPQKPEKAEKTDKAEMTVAKGWVVQVGVYSNRDNAARVESRLKSHGHTVREEHIKIATGTAVRLRVGPYRDKATAQKARDQIEKDVGEKAAVLPYP
jgi:DedD protein